MGWGRGAQQAREAGGRTARGTPVGAPCTRNPAASTPRAARPRLKRQALSAVAWPRAPLPLPAASAPSCLQCARSLAEPLPAVKGPPLPAALPACPAPRVQPCLTCEDPTLPAARPTPPNAYTPPPHPNHTCRSLSTYSLCPGIMLPTRCSWVPGGSEGRMDSKISMAAWWPCRHGTGWQTGGRFTVWNGLQRLAHSWACAQRGQVKRSAAAAPQHA